MVNKDPFEEFEFKPITEGLGFHKKASAAAADLTPETQILDPLLKDQGLSLIEEEPTTLRSPLPRKGFQINDKKVDIKENSSSTAVDEILKTLEKNKRFEFDESKSALRATAKDEYKATALSLSAGFLDSMLVMAAGLLGMIILLVITRADLIGNLSNPASSPMIYVATLAIFAGMNILYMLINRVFLGYTPGEWAFDQRIGKPDEMSTALYPIKLLARCLINIATGFIVLPIISAITNTDIAGKITGTQILKKV